MHRRLLNVREMFAKSAEEQAEQVMRVLQYRKEATNAAWEELEEGWKTINERMVKSGLRPCNDKEGVLKLNVGGSKVSVLWQLLAENEGFDDSILGALLGGVWDEGRIPLDADGRIVLDESPAFINRIIHTMLTGRASPQAVGLPKSTTHGTVGIDEVPCGIYTAHVMGLPRYMPTHPNYMKVEGGSTVLEPFEIAPLGAKIRGWIGGSTEQMTLIYRATRDGFDTKQFKPKCDEDTRSHVVSLVRVSTGQADDDSVVGGYSVLPWGAGSDVRLKQTVSAETFLFMLKDGRAARKGASKPTKWKPYPKHVGRTFVTGNLVGAAICANDLRTALNVPDGGYVLKTALETFDIEGDSPLLALSGEKVVDVEIYRCSTLASPVATTATNTSEPGGDVFTDAEVHDINSFGQLIATSLMEERVVLARAEKELEGARARVSAAVGALQTVYGPSVAAGEQDPVVELNVRGTRMTTLRSTLQVCPRSALATMFNEERCPATDKDKDGQGGRLIDCSPTCFSKILDVLRMRKRASWTRGGEGGEEGGKDGEEKLGKKGEWEGRREKEGALGGLGAVLIKKADVGAFSEAVNRYFPGCESFITDMVQSAQPRMSVHISPEKGTSSQSTSSTGLKSPPGKSSSPPVFGAPTPSQGAFSQLGSSAGVKSPPGKSASPSLFGIPPAPQDTSSKLASSTELKSRPGKSSSPPTSGAPTPSLGPSAQLASTAGLESPPDQNPPRPVFGAPTPSVGALSQLGLSAGVKSPPGKSASPSACGAPPPSQGALSQLGSSAGVKSPPGKSASPSAFGAPPPSQVGVSGGFSFGSVRA